MRQYMVTVFLLLGLGLQAQVYLPGKLVTTDGDTLVGFVSEQGGITWGFRETKNGPERLYTRRQVLAFERKDEKYEEYQIEVLRGKFPERVKDFLLVVEEGQVRLLRYDGKGLFNSSHTGYYLHEKGMRFPIRVNVDEVNFKVQMRQYFSDFEDLANKIKSKELKYENIQQIVQMYNSWYAQQPHDDEFKPGDASKPAKAPKEPKRSKIESEPLPESDDKSEGN
jgi:hypothetical protein